jgi:membrane protease YdiL (CAAX protease family)
MAFVMKKHLIVAGKAIAYFVLCAVTVAVMTVPSVSEPAFLGDNSALLRLWWELIPLTGVLIVTVIFVFAIEKNKIKISLLNNQIRNTVLGLLLGCAWLGTVIAILTFMGVLSFGNKNNVAYLPIWFIAVFFNVTMQNYLFRGYLFSLFREKYSTVAAVTLTTILFTAMHGGAFEAGAVAVLNVATMSVFVSLLLIYTKSLLAPIIVHFIWNSIGRLIFGVVYMTEDYPSLWSSSLTGNKLISGGSFQMEGSIVVLIINLLLIALIAYILKKRVK